MPPAAMYAGGAAIGAIGSILTGKSANRAQAREAEKARQWEGGPATAPVRFGVSQLMQDWMSKNPDLFPGDEDNRIRTRYREALDPDYFDVAAEGSGVYSMVDEYGRRTKGQRMNELDDALNAAGAKLGSQYGIRYGSDAARIMGDVGRRAWDSWNAREADLVPAFGQLWLSGRQASLGAANALRQDQLARLSPILQWSTATGGNPGMAPLSGFGMMNEGLSSASNALAMYPLYKQMLEGGTKTTVVS